MGDSDDPRLRYNRQLRRLDEDHDNGLIQTNDYEAIREFVLSHDPDNLQYNGEDRSYNTLVNYVSKLSKMARISDVPITKIDEQQLAKFFEDIHHGDIEGVKPGGVSKGTVRNYQNISRKFYEYHDDLGVDRENISVYKADKGGPDPREVFTLEDIMNIREVIDNPRDKALVDLLFFTGQRVRVVQTLKIRDIDLEAGEFIMPDAEGLKGADEVARRKPLLRAKKAVADWMQYHPTGKDNDYLITQRPKTSRGEPGSELTLSSIQHALNKHVDAAGIDKPANPHNFRHAFATVAKLHYEMDESTIKWMMGQVKDSSIFETTYQHLTDEDQIVKARESMGLTEEDTEETWTPEECDVCGELLHPDAKACPNCGSVIAPDARAIVDQKAEEEKEQAESVEAFGEAELITALLKKNPELAEHLDL